MLSGTPEEHPNTQRRAYNGSKTADECGAKPREESGAKPARPARFKSLIAFCKEYVPLSYAVEPIIRSSSLYTITAKTGGGKTAFLVDISLAVASGRGDLIGMEVQQGRVAYLSFENPDDIRMRFAIAAFLFNIDLGAIAENIIILDERRSTEDVEAGLRINAGLHGPFALVVGDTLAAMFDGKDINEAVQSGEFIRRVRPFTRLPGLPSTVLAAHPVKNASEQQLIPYGSGAILNEVDGNLTLWKRPDTGHVSLHWQGKLRGLEFNPVPFKFEISSSPDILDAKGRQVQIPILRPSSEQAAEERQEQEANRDIALLKAMAAEPDATQRRWSEVCRVPLTSVSRRLEKFEKHKLAEKNVVSGKWLLTSKAQREIGALQ